MEKQLGIAVLGGGCFWCLEAAYQQVKGVFSVESGYAGGKKPNPTYAEVCRGDSDHVEVVKVSFDASVLTYEDVLEIFFVIHDPTTLNRQGADVGSQYRSVIFYDGPAQSHMATQVIKRLQPLFSSPIVTAVEALPTYYPAENYHQNYYRNHPSEGYCQAVISPKLSKLRQKFSNRLN